MRQMTTSASVTKARVAMVPTSPVKNEMPPVTGELKTVSSRKESTSPEAGSTKYIERPSASQQRMFARAVVVPRVAGGRPLPREGQPSGLDRRPSGWSVGTPPQVRKTMS